MAATLPLGERLSRQVPTAFSQSRSIRRSSSLLRPPAPRHLILTPASLRSPALRSRQTGSAPLGLTGTLRSRPPRLGTRVIELSATEASKAAPTIGLDSAEQRSWRLTELVKLRRLYRCVLGAKYLLSLPTPLYNPPTPSGDTSPPVDDEEVSRTRVEWQTKAVQVIMAMHFTEEELQRALKLLDPSYGVLLDVADKSAGQASLEARVKAVAKELASRAADEAQLLPPEGKAQLLEEREGGADKNPEPAPDTQQADQDAPSGPLSAVVKGEKNLERYIVKRVAPYLKSKVEFSLQNPGWMISGARRVKEYGQGLWDRLNGRGNGTKSIPPSELGLPAPVSMKQDVERLVGQLTKEIDGLEKKVQDASKAREARLRSSGLQNKARIAVELMEMDREVTLLSHTLGVRTLQLEMLYIYQTLEQEALEITEFNREQIIPGTTASSNEDLALLVAEFSLLNSQLRIIATECADDACMVTLPSEDVDLRVLSREIPDLRSRLGIGDGLVFGGGGFSIRRIQMTATESVAKIAEGLAFLVTGFRVLGSDLSYAFQIFLRAARGGTLKPREVQALRRSVRDILTFIPFTIILLIPLSPVGHVLVFGFIQRYFPGLYPSQFTARRQEIMKRYEDLKKQLSDAQKQIQEENETRQLQAATEAVARLISPSPRSGPGDAAEEDEPKPARLLDLEARVAAAKDDHFRASSDEP